MDSVTLLTFQWLSFSVLIFFAPISSESLHHKIPRLSPLLETILRDPSENPSKSVSPDYEKFYYNQTLDHFNYHPESYTTFRQRYFVNSKYWGGANASAPIFAYLGAEGPIDHPENIAFLEDTAPQFKSLLVFIEHRFYGQSVPNVTFKEALTNETLGGYFSSAQAMADYAEVLLHIKQNLSAPHSPIVVIGGSYGGMLASWFRLKYPHIAIGALASSAPVLYFDDITPENGYYVIVTKNYRDASESCYETIKKSWCKIDEVASGPGGLSNLSEIFKTCRNLSTSSELKNYLESMYTATAQYNKPQKTGPPVTVVCGGVDGAPEGTDILGRIFAGVVAYKGNLSCYINNPSTKATQTNTNYTWHWQTCTEMVMPLGRGANDTMFPARPFNLNRFIENCEREYGVTPRPHWVTTYYGGHDIKRVLRKFASNIIFSNGLSDPYSVGGVLEDISKTVVAIVTVNGSHCLDIAKVDQSDPESNPQWLIEQKEKEVETIQGWISNYYDDLLFK